MKITITICTLITTSLFGGQILNKQPTNNIVTTNSIVTTNDIVLKIQDANVDLRKTKSDDRIRVSIKIVYSVRAKQARIKLPFIYLSLLVEDKSGTRYVVHFRSQESLNLKGKQTLIRSRIQCHVRNDLVEEDVPAKDPVEVDVSAFAPGGIVTINQEDLTVKGVDYKVLKSMVRAEVNGIEVARRPSSSGPITNKDTIPEDWYVPGKYQQKFRLLTPNH
jgi:hypothetical protein